MKKWYGILVASLLLHIGSKVSAQQDPLYSQYMFNGAIINPAYPSMDESISLTAVLRNQWVGLDGAPKTGSISAHMPLVATGTSLGFMGYFDKVGDISQTSAAFNVSQKVTLSDELFLGMGIRGGVSYYSEDNLKYNSPDPVYANDHRYWKTDIGVGFMLYSPRMCIGISSPTLQSFTITAKDGQKEWILNKASHFFMTGAYLFDLNEDVKFRPSTLLKFVKGAPFQGDLNANFLFKETLWAGASWRSSKSVVGILQLQATPELQIGYSYDYNYGKQIKDLQSGSHELMINYRFPGGASNRVVTPRYF